MEWIPQARKHLSNREPVFGWMMAKDVSIPFVIPKRIDLFGFFGARAIVSQQLSGRSGGNDFWPAASPFPREKIGPARAAAHACAQAAKSGIVAQ